MISRRSIEPFRRQNRLDDRVHDRSLEIRLRHVRIVLRRQHDGLYRHRPIVLVTKRDLTFRIGPEPCQLARLSYLGLALHEPVRIDDRRRHELLGLVARIAEHQALVAGALLFVRRTIDALSDIGGLLGQMIDDLAVMAIETEIIAPISNFADGISDERFDLELRLARDLTGNDDQVVLDECLAGDARSRVLCNQRIEHRIGDLITDLIRMTFRNRFRREYVAACHGLNDSSKTGCGPDLQFDGPPERRASLPKTAPRSNLRGAVRPHH